VTARNYDINGWFEVKDNPLSKVGVFPYSGAMIDASGEFGLDQNKIYNVLRPQEELEDSECHESLKLLPWIDGHVMLGDDFNLTPAEEKGVSGVIGEDIYFDEKDLTLKGNVKVFAENLKDEIDKGKRELSLGYRCKYEKESGIFDGEKYDFVQRRIRGNHLASVDQGRMGPEVAVLDGNLLTFTLDSKELVMTPEEMGKAIKGLLESVKALSEKVSGMDAKAAKAKDEDELKKAEDAKKAEDEEVLKKKKEKEDLEKTKDEEDPEKKKKDDSAMDSLVSDNNDLKETVKTLQATVDSFEKTGMKTLIKTISARDALAKSLSNHVGTFDHSEMTLDEVAVYGAEKLELKCEKGSELATVNGFLHNRDVSQTVTLDSKTDGKSMDGLDDYIKGSKK